MDRDNYDLEPGAFVAWILAFVFIAVAAYVAFFWMASTSQGISG